MHQVTFSDRAFAPWQVAAAGAACLQGCGVGCLYGETGKVVLVHPSTQVTPERLIEVLGNGLRPLGFSGSPWNPSTPLPEKYWDYEFSSPASGSWLHERAPVNIRIKFDDLSVTLIDGQRGSVSKATDFDRRAMGAIQEAVRADLGADITFAQPKMPAFCLGP